MKLNVGFVGFDGTESKELFLQFIKLKNQKELPAT
jgi:hypothetical protein